VKEVFATRNPAEAHLVRGLLENAGIAAVVENDVLSQWVGEIVGEMLPRVCVLDESEVERAAAIVAEWQREEPEAPAWECPKCGEKIGGRFTSCWECGTERP
jgi:predicted RNA-binding Zn-ribbon protein involved in translation (DUF1610 family)